MKEISDIYLNLIVMFQGVLGQLLIDAVTIPTRTTKHATMVTTLLIYSAKFVEEVCRLRKKELTHQ
jgi:hypothetical protein